MAGDQFSLCWDNFHKNMSSGMHALLESEDLVDVTLAVEGKYLKAHKMVLSVCSPYFRDLFQMNPCKHPIVFMKDVSFAAMSDLLTFMYKGEVQVNQAELTTFIKTAEALQIKGLTSDGNTELAEEPPDEPPAVNETQNPPTLALNNKEVQLTKSTAKSKASTSQHIAAKRPRVSTPTAVVTLKETPVIKDDIVQPETTETTQDLIQFKMEPYETDQFDPEDGAYENVDEAMGEEGMDDGQMEDGDFTIAMKGDGEEPKAGTSSDGVGESQEVAKTRRKKGKPERIVFNGFVYHTSVVRHSPPVRYLICSKYISAGCRGRAILPIDADTANLRITQPHNHPPDNTVEIKYEFLRKLKLAVQNVSHVALKALFDEMIALYPTIAGEFTYESLRSSLRRWRKEAER